MGSRIRGGRVKAENPQTGEGVAIGTRKCRWCGHYFFCPVGSPRGTGCPKCQPTIMDAIEEVESNGSADRQGTLPEVQTREGPPPERDLLDRGMLLPRAGDHPGPTDDDLRLALCSECRAQPAVGRLNDELRCLDCLEAALGIDDPDRSDGKLVFRHWAPVRLRPPKPRTWDSPELEFQRAAWKRYTESQ